MSFKQSKAKILANSAADDSNISTMAAELATTAIVDNGYTLCTDGRYLIYNEYYDDAYSTVDKIKNLNNLNTNLLQIGQTLKIPTNS